MYTLNNKPNWAEARDRFITWWNREETDRPLLIIKSNRDDPPHEPPPPPETVDEKWLDIDSIIQRKKAEIACTCYFAESFPYIHPALGPGTLGTYLGATPEFSVDTVWYEKCFDDPTQASGTLDQNNEWWQWTRTYTDRICSMCEEDYIPAFPDFIENLDTAAELLGTVETVFALNDVPEEMHRLQKEILESFFTAYDTIFDNMYPDADESVFMGFDIWGPGRIAKIQSDIAALLSPALYEEFALPYFIKQCKKLDYVLYHLDGPDAIYSLDSILTIEDLDAVQWVPGAGAAPPDDSSWDSLYTRILDAGKSIWAAVRPENAVEFKKKFGSRGVYMLINHRFKNEQEASEFLALMEK